MLAQQRISSDLEQSFLKLYERWVTLTNTCYRHEQTGAMREVADFMFSTPLTAVEMTRLYNEVLPAHRKDAKLEKLFLNEVAHIYNNRDQLLPIFYRLAKERADIETLVAVWESCGAFLHSCFGPYSRG